MKFTLQLEVEAPPNDNENFCRAVHAIQWLQDQLQLAITTRLRLQAKSDNQDFIKYQENHIKNLERVIMTVEEKK